MLAFLLNALTVLFVYLKLTHVIAWSWFFVILPTLAWLALILLIWIGIIIFAYKASH